MAVELQVAARKELEVMLYLTQAKEYAGVYYLPGQILLWRVV